MKLTQLLLALFVMSGMIEVFGQGEPPDKPMPPRQREEYLKKRQAQQEAAAKRAAEKKARAVQRKAVKVNPLLFPERLRERAPEVFQARFETTKGEFIVEVYRAWSPNGADRFYNLVKNGFYDECRFFRVMSRFMAQVGMNGTPRINAIWSRSTIRDDPVMKLNTRGMVTFAMTSAPNSRTTQFFINYGDNSRLAKFVPFGKVVKGMRNVDAIHSRYGQTPSQKEIAAKGNVYLKKRFPKLDYIKLATIVKEPEDDKKKPAPKKKEGKK
jgi:peptidyl-prolyl cis-trans isomerase A (cyclophilin A)